MVGLIKRGTSENSSGYLTVANCCAAVDKCSMWNLILHDAKHSHFHYPSAAAPRVRVHCRSPVRPQYTASELQVLASDCSGVPSRLVHASVNHRQLPLPTFSLLLLSGPAASLRVPPNSGTAYHCHSAIRHWHLDNSAAGWKLIYLD